MKKTILSILALAFTSAYFLTACSPKASSSQSGSRGSSAGSEGQKLLYYNKIKSAKDAFQRVVNNNPKDANALYWLGQAFIADRQIDSATALYQNALNSGVNDPWIWVGLGHVELLQGGDINAAKQRFEQAITATKTKKGTDNPDILNAIGRANAAGGNKVGDPNYAIEKLKVAQQLDPNNPDIDINLGINYLKLGSQHGGEAVEAFRDATVRDPNYAAGYTRIGRVYQSQNNVEAMNEWYGKAITADPTYAPVYLAYFNYYKDRDVNVAKEYIDKYAANSDPDCNTQAFVADYLFRAGKYQESINKADSMAAGECKNFPGLSILYAYNYSRLGDSTKALNYMQQYFAQAAAGDIDPETYVLAGSIYGKVSGYEDTAASYITRAMELDTVAKNKPMYIDSIASIYKRANRPQERLQWLRQSYSLAANPTNRDIYDLADAALNAGEYALADSMFALYKEKYPDQVYGYFGAVKSAQAQDTTGAAAVGPMTDYINFMMADTAKNAASIAYYHALLGGYYANVAKDIDTSISHFQEAVRFAPENEQYQQYLDILTKAQQKANEPAKKSTAPRSRSRTK